MKKIIVMSLVSIFAIASEPSLAEKSDEVINKSYDKVMDKWDNNDDKMDGIALTFSDWVKKQVTHKKLKWDEAESGVSVDIGGWYINWTQNSNSGDSFPENALNMDYNIEDSVATVLRLRANYKLIPIEFEYYSSGLDSEKGQEADGFSMGFSLIDMIPNLDVEFNFLKANFRGELKANYKGEYPSSGDFETELQILNAIIYPFNQYLGFGYRKYNYEFPQDMYIVENKTGEVLHQGLANIEYDGYFYQAVFGNKRFYENSLIFNIAVGKGKLESTAEGFNQYLTDLDAEFLEAIIGYNIQEKFLDGYDVDFDFGYKYNYISTKYKTSGDYNMVTEFSTIFSGPFANMSINF